jgi:hypothetical protein
MFVDGPEAELRIGVALISRLLIPTHRDRVVLRHTTAIFVHDPEIGLSWDVALIGEGRPQLDRGRIVTATIRG